MAYNPWKITKDIIDDGEANGVKSADWEDNVECNDFTVIEFRLLDDDKNVYFEGLMRLHDFEPLDDFGRGWGCTELQYINEHGSWDTL